MSTKVVALLPMKAHSERVKGKNFRELAGKPLFRWILDSLLAVEAIGQVIINTDARHILQEMGLREGERVSIRDRRADLCGDMVSMNRIIEDDIGAAAADAYIMTHTTNPLLGSSTIERALQAYEAGVRAGTADSLFGVTRYQTRFYRGDGSPINHDPNNLIRTQDLEPWFEENSNIYIFSRSSFASTAARIGRSPILFPIPKLEAFDIDEPEDWLIAEAVAKRLTEATAA